MPGMALISGQCSLAVQKIAIIRSASEVIRGIPVEGPSRRTICLSRCLSRDIGGAANG